MSPAILLTVYCALILVASLAGGWVPLRVRLTHTRLQVATSFVAGLMLGVGVLHLLPHAWYELGSIDRCAWWMLGGFLVMFLIQRFFHFHHHDVPEESPEGTDEAEPSPGSGHGHAGGGRDHAVEHSDHCHHDHTLAEKSARHLSWTGAALGLTLHTLIDGFAVAASVEAESHGSGRAGLLGLGTFLVVILHKPFDSLAISTLMAAGGWSKKARQQVNALFALAIPIGILMFQFGSSRFSGSGESFLGSALAFTAGSFLCIAASDLLPELQFHAHDRVKLSVALMAGLSVSAIIGRFETSGHDRHHPEPGEPRTAPAISEPGGNSAKPH
jgi:zinc and cadmium transporter